MNGDPEASLIDNIVEVAEEISDQCPSCASTAAEIIA